MEILVIRNYKTVADIDVSLKGMARKSWKVLEAEASRIVRDPKTYKRVAFMIGIGLFMAAQPTFTGNLICYAAGPGGINAMGMKFWSYVKVFARWGCLVMCGLDVVKNLNSGDAKGISKVLFKYVLAYAIVVLLPWVFDEIDGAIK